MTAKDLTGDDRARLNGHILDILGKSDFNHGPFEGEVQRALARPLSGHPERTPITAGPL